MARLSMPMTVCAVPRYFSRVAALFAVVLITCGAPVSASDPAADAAAKGRAFLAGLFNAELGLLPEYETATTYWLFHDNYLAAKVLAETHPQIAEAIKGALAREKIGASGKIEILFGEAARPLPFREFKLVNVRRVGTKLIRTEIATDVPLKGWTHYADLLLFATIAAGNEVEATRYWNAAMELWDGKGFLDEAARAHQRYATYKLGLALHAGARMLPAPKILETIKAKLLSLQSDSGGWITDYDEQGHRLGVANVETTCLAILGLERSGRN